MALFEGVETVFYQVCSMDKAVAFYRDVLGLELRRREGNDWAESTIGGVDLALSDELAVPPQQGGATVVLRTGDIDSLETHLGRNGVTKGIVRISVGIESVDDILWDLDRALTAAAGWPPPGGLPDRTPGQQRHPRRA